MSYTAAVVIAVKEAELNSVARIAPGTSDAYAMKERGE